MEVVIPPRDHGPSYRYVWDNDGQVERIERVRFQESNEQRDSTVSRQTVQWPFLRHQSSASDVASSRPFTGFTGSFPDPQSFPPKEPKEPVRRATWAPGKRNSTATILENIVPDYIINYIRGETPETMAQRREERKRQTESPDTMEAQAAAANHAAAQGFYDEATTDRPSTAENGIGDLEQMLPPGEKRGGGGTFSRMKSGWRAGIALNIIIGFAILIVAIVCLVLALVVVGMVRGESIIFKGSCAAADQLKIGLFVAINVITIVLLSAANYVFQVLSSPTRIEIEMAHDGRRWLDLGIPSFRNLRFVSKPRVVMTAIIMLAAVGTQVIYNAVIFSTQPGYAHQVVFVTQEFLASGQFSNTSETNAGGLSRSDILDLQDLASRNQLTNFTNAECAREFGGVYQSDFTAVVLVTDVVAPSNALVQTQPSGSSLAQFINPSDPSQIKINSASVDYCLARLDTHNACTVVLNGSLLGVIAILNLVSVSAIGAVYFFTGFEPLVTLGDALASFISQPDHTTRGICLLDKTDVKQGRWGYREAKYWTSRDHFWFQTPDLTLWTVWFLTWAAPAGLAAAALGVSLGKAPSSSLGAFGSALPHELYPLPDGSPRAGVAIVAALPHLLLAALYLSTNALLSTYYLSHELSQYALPGISLPLRVSSGRPRGTQTTSLYLTLPRPLSWLLLALFAALGLVLSNAVPVVSVDMRPATRDDRFPEPINGVGFSGVGLLAFLALMVVVVALVLGLGFRRADPSPTSVDGEKAGNPLVLRGGSCSAVITSRCHRPPSDVGAAHRNVAWGVVDEESDTTFGHATFTSQAVSVLDPAKGYA
ncbi:hypothetical protein CORC01_09424 [Colletotrichum orchidophilum]|uniref:DUF6536 domain-containing protein n=1 Tax=Colletotrichum orchidophilum TaxID=1209926 RepID=A0A1G4B1G3_9PEZI|nr:uncharacterized protein CORC01_09424 [Colletotrichum orchidophilum]OHE95279.1 hypothetical protein CORC01_09424 [Colletotrichum orchidophilum]